MSDIEVHLPDPATRTAAFDVVGEVDLLDDGSITDIVQSLLAAGAWEVVADLSRVTFIGSTGLTDLVRSLKACAERDVTLRLHDPSPRVLRLLELTGLTAMFGVRTGPPQPFPRPAPPSRPGTVVPLTRRCRSCGARRAAHARTCPQCGAP